MTGPDLHADSECWQDNLDEADCEACGGPRVVFIPVWADGSGILTPGEIAEVLGAARMKVLNEWERSAPRSLEPMSILLPEDIVLRIDGRRDGSFRAVILASGGGVRQAQARFGTGSEYTGAFGWRHGLALSRHVSVDTTPEEAAEGLTAYEGAPGILNFTRRGVYERRTHEAQEEFRLGRALRDRTSRSTAWDRNAAGRASPRPRDGGDGDDAEPSSSS